MQPGQVAIVTGGAGLIGTAVAERLAEGGGAVAVFDLQEMGVAGGHHMYLNCDVADRAAVAQVVAKVAAQLGTPSVLVNCAGGFQLRPFLQIGDEDWSETIRANAGLPTRPARPRCSR